MPLYASARDFVAQSCKKAFGKADLLLLSPGRINLLGEHTDYNEGWVLPAAIDLGIYMAFRRNENDKIRLVAGDLEENIEVALSHEGPVSAAWANYVLGMAAQLRQAGCALQGFDLVFAGNLPRGAGLSSSAALSCGAGEGLNQLFGFGIPRGRLAQMAQAAEHQYAGVRCGIMDPMACLMGRQDQAMLLDCRSLDIEYVPAANKHYAWVIVNSGVSHALVATAYNQRRAECEAGLQVLAAQFSGIQALRDVSAEQLRAVETQLPPEVLKRCRYVIAENERVLRAARVLRSRDWAGMGTLMNKTHQGLSKLYEVSCPELDFLAETAMAVPGVLGARMMGGGFGGCTLNLLRLDALGAFEQAMTERYAVQYGRSAGVYLVQLGEGVRAVK